MNFSAKFKKSKRKQREEIERIQKEKERKEFENVSSCADDVLEKFGFGNPSKDSSTNFYLNKIVI